MLRCVRIANFLWAAMFTFAAVVQYNDPDPMRWIAIYAAGSLTCVLWELRLLPRSIAIAVTLTALGWGAWTLLHTRLTSPLDEALTDWSMHAGGSEELRESLGLFLIAGWCAVLAWKPERRVAAA